MNPQVVVVGPAVNANASLFFAAATPTSGVALTLLTNALDVPRRISLVYGNEGSARTLLLTGKDRYGNPITETLSVPAGGAGSPIRTNQDFSYLASALPLGGGWTNNITLGTNGRFSSEWKIVDRYVTPMNMSIGVNTSGTLNWSIEYTYNDLNALSLSGNRGFNQNLIPDVYLHFTLVNQTGNADGFINDPIWAWRLTINTFTNPANAIATGIQAGMTQGGWV